MNGKLGDFYFERSNGERVLLAENVNQDEAFKVMQKFLTDHNYKSYYTRVWTEGNELWMDVGSWSEFGVLVFQEDVICGNQRKI